MQNPLSPSQTTTTRKRDYITAVMATSSLWCTHDKLLWCRASRKTLQGKRLERTKDIIAVLCPTTDNKLTLETLGTSLHLADPPRIPQLLNSPTCRWGKTTCTTMAALVQPDQQGDAAVGLYLVRHSIKKQTCSLPLRLRPPAQATRLRRQTGNQQFRHLCVIRRLTST